MQTFAGACKRLQVSAKKRPSTRRRGGFASEGRSPYFYRFKRGFVSALFTVLSAAQISLNFKGADFSLEGLKGMAEFPLFTV